MFVDPKKRKIVQRIWAVLAIFIMISMILLYFPVFF